MLRSPRTRRYWSRGSLPDLVALLQERPSLVRQLQLEDVIVSEHVPDILMADQVLLEVANVPLEEPNGTPQQLVSADPENSVNEGPEVVVLEAPAANYINVVEEM